MKKLCAFFLATLLCLTMAQALVCAAPAELIKNGGFEELNADGTFASWGILGDAAHIKLDTDVHEGKNAARMTCATENISVTQRVSGITGGSEYTLTSYVKAVSLVGKVQIKIEFYSGDEALEGTEKKTDMTEVVRRYQPLVVTFNAPSTATRMNILFRVLGGGDVLWDGISLKGEGAPAVSADGMADFIKNGDFEALNADGTFASWRMAGGELGAGYEVATSANGGKNAIRMTADSANITASQSVSGLVGGTEYVITGYLKAMKINGGGAQIKLEFYAGDTAIETVVKENYTETVSRYMPKVITFNAPTDATRANVLVRLLGGGDIYWDDVSLKGQFDAKAVVAAPAEPEKTEEKKPEETKEPEAVLQGMPNLLVNADMELANGAGPANWDPYKGTPWGENTFLTYDSTLVHGGSKAIKLANQTDGENPWARQTVAVSPGTPYQISGYVNMPEAVGTNSVGYGSVKLEFYGENHSSEGEARMGTFRGTGNEWYAFAETFTVPATATELTIYLRLYGLGTVSYDDVKLCATSEPARLTINTDEVFYYTDFVGMGTATVKMNTAAYPDLAGASVDIALKKGDTVLAESKGVPTQNGLANYSYDLALLTEKQTEYTVVATYGEYKAEALIYKYDRPQYLGADGIYREDGKIVSPVFAYRYRDYQYPIGLENGINVGQLAMPTDKEGQDLVAYMRTALDKAEAAGVKCLIALYRNMLPAGNAANYDTSALIVSTFREHKGVFGWMVMDETFSHLPNPEDDLRKSFMVIRNNDPYHPVYMCEATTRLTEAGKYCDILCVDPYPGNHSAPETYPAERVKAALEAVKYRKPVYSLLQAIDWQEYFPTGDEMRNMLYQSLVAGASAVGYYKFEDSVGKADLNETELWPYITAFAQNEQQDAFDAFAHGKYPIFNANFGEDAWYISYIKDGALYMLVLNRKATAQTVNIPLESFTGTVKIGAFTGTIVGGGEGSVSGDGTLAAQVIKSGATLYRLTPSTAVDFSAVQTTGYRDLYTHLWARDQIIGIEKQGVVSAASGYSFLPGNKITRGEFAYFLVRTLGLTSDSTENFADVGADTFYAKEIAIGKALGILKGVGDNRYNPYAEISRQDLMVICARGMRLVKALEDGEITGFSDAAAVADYAVADIAAMVRTSIVQGNADGTLNPLGNTTKAEAAVIMHRIGNWKAQP